MHLQNQKQNIFYLIEKFDFRRETVFDVSYSDFLWPYAKSRWSITYSILILNERAIDHLKIFPYDYRYLHIREVIITIIITKTMFT